MLEAAGDLEGSQAPHSTSLMMGRRGEDQTHRPRRGSIAPRGLCAAVRDCATSMCVSVRSMFTGCCGKTIRLASGRSVRVRRLLAEGGFSYVYLVEDVKTHTPYALKVMICHSAEQGGRARWEAEVHQSFKHPNLLALEDVDYHTTAPGREDALFLFDYFPRGTLQDALNRAPSPGRAFSEAECLRFFSGVCSAVRALHHHEPPWAHRDIKPHNVLISGDGLPVLMDFGSTAVARVEVASRFEALQLQELAQQHCSMPYRAPELYDVPSTTVITEKTDIWSLGCTLYALAFGYSPFEVEYNADDSPRVVEVSQLRVIGRVPFPRAPRFSPGFLDLIRWMLTVDPAARPDIDDVILRVGQAGTASQDELKV